MKCSRMICAPSLVLGLWIMPLAAAPARAQETPGDAKNALAFYLWGTGISGDMTVRGTTVPVEVSFDEILDHLDFAAFLHYERGAQPWGFALDTMYVDLSADFTGTGPGMASGTSSMTLWEAEAAAVRRWDMSGSDLNVDLILGLRYWYLEQTIDRAMLQSIEGDKDWLDAVVGGRLIAPFGGKWLFSLRLDAATGGSDIAWNGTALFNWQFSRVTSLVFGYRYLHEDYEDGDGSQRFALDSDMEGLAVGLGFMW